MSARVQVRLLILLALTVALLVFIVGLYYGFPKVCPRLTARYSPFVILTVNALDELQFIDRADLNLHRFSKEQLKAVSGLISHASERTRLSCYMLLCSRPEPDCISAVVGGLRDPSIFIRSEVILGLRCFKDVDSGEIRELLLIHSQDADPQIRSHVADTLGYFPHHEVKERLVKMMDDGNDMVVYYTLRALDKMKYFSGKERELLKLSFHESVLVRKLAKEIIDSSCVP